MLPKAITPLWQVLDGAAEEEFRRRKSGAIITEDLDNIRLALTKPGVDLRYDSFAQQVLTIGCRASTRRMMHWREPDPKWPHLRHQSGVGADS